MDLLWLELETSRTDSTLGNNQRDDYAKAGARGIKPLPEMKMCGRKEGSQEI
jgi:hypothetical protein